MSQAERKGQEQPLGGLRILRVADIDVFVNRTWLIIFALVAASLGGGYFPGALPGRSIALHWSLGAVSALLLFACILAHEMTHSLVAKYCGLHISGITLFLFGGVSNLTSGPKDPATEFKIALSGPLASLMLGGLFYLLWAAAVGWPALSAVLAYLAVVNLLLALFNIIPGFPLDGGRVLRAFLWWKTADLKRSTVLAARVGAGVGWALVAAGLLLFFGDPVGGAWLILIGLFLRSAANFSSERAERGQEV